MAGRSARDTHLRGAHIPSVAYPPIRVTRISPAHFNLGIEEHRIEGGVVRVYSVARTVVDCFRFRNKIGLDVAMEALIEARRSRRLDLNELEKVAKALRLDRVMRPYLEMLVA
jgi:predicted transcriptional regulator of viral defense system